MMTRRLISVLFLLAALAAFVVSADEFSPTNLVDFGCYEYQADPASIFFIR